MNVLVRSLSTIILISLMAVIARLAVSDFYYERANTFYKTKSRAEQISADIYDTVIKDVDRSLSWRPDNAEALDLKADVLFQSWWLSPDGQYLHQSKKLQNAVDYHLKAVRLRPSWSYTAARLALIYSHQEILDDNFNYWFSRAYKLGLYETGIARSMMNVGFIHWANINENQRQQTLTFARISIEQKYNSIEYLKSVFQEYNKTQLVCLQIKSTVRSNLICK